MEKILEVKDLRTYFYTYHGVVKAVDGVSFDLSRGELLGIVGESGSGKSVTSLSILNLIDIPGKIVGGQILFKGEDLVKATPAQMQKIRGAQISMIFQNPRNCLNPVISVGDQITRIYTLHEGADHKKSSKKAIEMLQLVNIGDPERIMARYPHELSGGMCQRVMIVMALMCSPDILIADEPTTGLDVTVQNQIMTLMRDLRGKTNAGQIIITHDIGVVAETCDRVAVMYAGQLMETADTVTLFQNPSHPYTQGLLRSIPRLDKDIEMKIVPGYVPSLIDLPTGCLFHPRCDQKIDICDKEVPCLVDVAPGHKAACHLLTR
jgi:oligopeptide/dipeptide ABC transporter ATP-binding protein